MWHPAAAAAAKLLQSCPTLCDPIDGSHQAPPSWNSPGKNTGVGYHFLLQCMKVKSESEVPQSYPTLSDPMDCSPPGSSVHGILQAPVLEWGAIAFSMWHPSECEMVAHCGFDFCFLNDYDFEQLFMSLLAVLYSLRRGVYSSPLLTFKLGCLSFCCWTMRVPYIFG